MTIYSGFPTRKLQERYNGLITEALELLSQLIITYVEHSKIEPFEKQFRRLFVNMEKMDELKHLQPKFSLVLKPLSEHVFLLDDRPKTVPETNFLHVHSNNEKKRPMTSNNFIQERRHSIEFQRKTINVVPDKGKHLIDRYGRSQKGGRRHQSFSVKNSMHRDEKQKEFEIPVNVTMEELMEKNRLVERKMTLFRKKKHLQPAKFGKIQQLDQQEDASFL